MVERKRHLAKAITYRAFGSATTAAIAYAVTGHVGISLSAGAADSVVKIVGYYIHERIWYRIRWGIRGAEQPPADMATADTKPAASNTRPESPHITVRPLKPVHRPAPQPAVLD